MISSFFGRARMAAIALIPVAASFVYTPGASGASAFPSIGTNGISFSASVPTDPQRDVGEPEVHIDRAGNIYTCGPSGFSNVADYMQISTDGGDQFHLLGAPPRGQISGGEGGGDCGLATGTEPNAKGNYTLAYSGLGPLANFSTFTSDDMGQTIHASPVSESVPGVDRQWHVFTGPNTVLFNYNSNSSDYTVQKSTDGGLTYGQPISTGAGGGRIGPLRAILSPDKDPDKAVVYFPSYLGSTITVTRSLDGGATWATCVVTDSELNPSAGFVIADNDTAGNVYIVYSEKGGDHDTYMTVMPASAMAGCADSVELNAKQFRVNRDSVDTTVMPWVVAGAPGRIAVAFFGTDSDGDPDDGSFVASWYPYVSMSLNALSGNPTWAQTRATTHPFHYGSICLGGLSCDISVPKGDRSLADYFAMDLSTITGRLSIVYGSSAKKPDDAVGHVSTATVVVQETGPGLLGGTLSARRPVLRPSTTDAEGDALAPYSQLYPLTANRANLPAMDITSVAVGPEIDLDSGDPVDDPGVTITMKVKDLSNSALQSAAQGTGTPSQSLVYLFRFLNGFQPAGATAAWNPATGFSFGFDNFTTKSAESGQPDPTSEKIIVWPQATSIKGKVNQDAGIIQLSVPRSLLHIQSGSTGPDSVPELTDAIDGSRLFDGTAFTLGNTFTPLQADQSYLYPVDETASMDFLVGKATYPTTGGTTGGGSTGGNEGNKNTGGNNGGTTTPPPATLPTTGASSGFSLALLVLMSTAGVLIYVRRRSAA
jgi:LPXTG-motif cell wall-anchored protein